MGESWLNIFFGKKMKEPIMGAKVEITWCKNPINHPTTKNCYIGTIGRFHERASDGGYWLKQESNGANIYFGKLKTFKFKYID